MPEASKLTEFLARNEVEELLEAHDTIVRNYFPDIESDLSKQVTSIYNSNIDQDTHIKIIKIEKTNEPLVNLKLSHFKINKPNKENMSHVYVIILFFI